MAYTNDHLTYCPRKYFGCVGLDAARALSDCYPMLQNDCMENRNLYLFPKEVAFKMHFYDKNGAITPQILAKKKLTVKLRPCRYVERDSVLSSLGSAEQPPPEGGGSQ